MGSGLTFFLDSRPSRWDPGFVRRDDWGHMEASDSYRSILEFYLKTQDTGSRHFSLPKSPLRCQRALGQG